MRVRAVRRYMVCHISAWMVLPFVVGYPTYLLTDSVKPFDFVSGHITPGSVFAGDAVTITWDAPEIRRDCEGQVSRYFVDANGTLFQMEVVPTIYSTVREPDKDRFARQMLTPVGLAAGNAYYQSRIRYQCNWLQRALTAAGWGAWVSINSTSPRVPFNVLATPLRIIPMLQ